MAIDKQPCVLVIAGTDSSGGAGMARDIETITSLGGKACLAVTAVTVQTHHAVRQVETLQAALVAAQMRAALEANPVTAIKIGMLATEEIVLAVSDVLREHPSLPIVLDPVIISSSGGRLLTAEAIDTMKRDLLPLCRLVTPNIPELAMLTGAAQPASSDEDAIAQARALRATRNALLIKGGHSANPQATDLLIDSDGTIIRFDAPRLSASLRGTGCMLASAIATHLAAGGTLEASVRRAKEYVFAKLLTSTRNPASD